MKKAIIMMIMVAMVAGITLLTGCATKGRVEKIEERMNSLLDEYTKKVGVDGYAQGIEGIEINIKIKLQPSQVRSEPENSAPIAEGSKTDKKGKN